MSYRWQSHHLMASYALTCQLADFTSQRSIGKVLATTCAVRWVSKVF
jgi:hypothetical protein